MLEIITAAQPLPGRTGFAERSAGDQYQAAHAFGGAAAFGDYPSAQENPSAFFNRANITRRHAARASTEQANLRKHHDTSISAHIRSKFRARRIFSRNVFSQKHSPKHLFRLDARLGGEAFPMTKSYSTPFSVISNVLMCTMSIYLRIRY
jgi:hypothetical protein